MFHIKSVPTKQRPFAPPILILVAMLICIFVPSPLTTPKPPTSAFRPSRIEPGSSRQHHFAQQQPSDVERQSDSQKQIDAQNRIGAQQPPGAQRQPDIQHLEAQSQSDALKTSDTQQLPDTQNQSGVQQEINFNTESNDIELPAAQHPAVEQLPAQSKLGSNEPANSDTDGPPDGFKRCSHIVLFSAARHGSTWFIDSVEGCTFTRGNSGTYGSLNAQTEIWNSGQDGIVLNMSVEDAVHYVAHNMSLKFFPSPMKFRQDDAAAVIHGAHQHNIPFVMLTRKPESAFKSLLVARETNVWNSVSNRSPESVELPLEDKEFIVYRKSISRHFESARNILESKGIPYDVFDYDVVKTVPWIILPKSLCYIRNCNFETSATNNYSDANAP